jgi:polygalacturonase
LSTNADRARWVALSSDQALRIKTDADATGASVTNVTYSGNTATGMRQFGVLIDQSYPDTLGTPGSGVKISVRASFLFCLIQAPS